MFFFRDNTGRSSSKSKGTGNRHISGRKGTTALAANQHDVKGSTPDKADLLLMQVSHLQSEMARLNSQLASMQAYALKNHAKEEHSTERSSQTFYTKGSTPGRIPSAMTNTTTESGAPMQIVSHVPSGNRSNDRPPPVLHISVPTPTITDRAVEQSRNCIRSNEIPKSITAMKGGSSPLILHRHTRNHHHCREKVPSEDERLANNTYLPPHQPGNRPRSFQSSMPSSAGPSRAGSRSATRSIRYRTVRRISSGGMPSICDSNDAPSPPRPLMRGKKALQPPSLLNCIDNGNHTPLKMTGEAPKSKPIDFEHSEAIIWPPTKNSNEVNHPNVEAVAPAKSERDEKRRQTVQSDASSVEDFSPLIVNKSNAIRVANRDELLLTSQLQKSDLKFRPSIETAQLENE